MSIMFLHTAELVGLRNRATRGRKHHGELISAIIWSGDNP